MTSKCNNNNYFWAWSGFILASLFYFYEFCLQVSPTVITDPLMIFFKTNAVGVGLISGFYFYAYTLMQIPVGMIYDRYSTRKVLVIANFICATSTLLFINTNSVFVACLARFLMGAGSAFAFVAVIIFVNRWFKPIYFATLIGVAQLMSSLGAMSAETPLILLVNHWGWREAFLGIAMVGFILGILTWFLARDGEVTSLPQKSSWADEKNKLICLLKDKQTCAIALYTFFIWAPITAFAGLWGVPFIRTVYHYSEYTASAFCALIWLAIGIASPIAGIVSDKFKNRKKVLTWLAVIGLIGSILLIYFPSDTKVLLLLYLVLIGIAAGGQALSFAVVNDNNSTHNVGTASGINNMATVAGGAIFQPLIGYFLKIYSSGHMINGMPTYITVDYQVAMISLPLCFLGAILVSIYFLEESYSK